MTVSLKALATTLLGLVVVAWTPADALAAADSVVNLPYMQPDKDGNQWMVHFYGYLQQQGNMPVYSNAGVLTINGASSTGRVASARRRSTARPASWSSRTCQIGGFTVTRRFQFNKDEGYVRIIDVITNTQNRDQTGAARAQRQRQLRRAKRPDDPRPQEEGPEHRVGRLRPRPTTARSSRSSTASAPRRRSASTTSTGNSQVIGNLSVNVPAGKEIAVMHVHAVANSAAEAQDWSRSSRSPRRSRTSRPRSRKLIVNFNASSAFYGDYEVLRGELFDVVEMRTGDQFRGTLKDAIVQDRHVLRPRHLPAEKVISVISIGAVRPRPARSSRPTAT